jgi:hypothetical protein
MKKHVLLENQKDNAIAKDAVKLPYLTINFLNLFIIKPPVILNFVFYYNNILNICAYFVANGIFMPLNGSFYLKIYFLSYLVIVKSQQLKM